MITLTHSNLVRARACLKSWQYRHEYGLVADVDADALRIGTAVHRGIELWRNELPDRRSSAAPDILERVSAEFPAGNDPYVAAMALGCLSAYFDRYADEDRDTVWPYIEMSFRLGLRNPETGGISRTFDLRGKVDAISVDCPWETKTTSEDISPGSNYLLRLRNDPQISTYLTALRKLGYDYPFIRYDVIRKPSIRPRQVALLDENGDKIVLDEQDQRVYTAQGKPRQTPDAERGWTLQSTIETPDQYAERVVETMLVAPDAYFARVDVYRLDDHLEQHEADLWQTGQLLLNCMNKKQFPRTISRWTCGFCPYAPLCLTNIAVDPASAPPTGYRFENPNNELEDSV